MDSKRSLPDIQDAMKKNFVTGMSVAAIDGKNIWNGSVGVSNMKSGDPITAETVFEAASLSKPVFAYLVLKLIENGELPSNFLDQPLYKILPHYKPFLEILRRNMTSI